jgi:septal ring factor EnvC (AmiA/AmiB activator)
LLVVLLLGLLLGGSEISYTLNQTELLSELQMISNDFDTAQSYIEQGLLKVENSLKEQDERYQKLDERLQKAEQLLKKANQELMTSEQDSATLSQDLSDLTDSFERYRKKKDRESKLLKLGLGAALVVILAESIALALK